MDLQEKISEKYLDPLKENNAAQVHARVTYSNLLVVIYKRGSGFSGKALLGMVAVAIDVYVNCNQKS